LTTIYNFTIIFNIINPNLLNFMRPEEYDSKWYLSEVEKQMQRIYQSADTGIYAEDLAVNLRGLDYGNDAKSIDVARQVIELMANSKPGELAENAFQLLKANATPGYCFPNALKEALFERDRIIFGQISQYVIPGTICDWGCGGGGFAELARDELQREVHGCDIADYRRPDRVASFPFFRTNGENAPDMQNGFFDNVVLSNVAHHTPFSMENMLYEINRIMAMGGRLLMTETVPSQDKISSLIQEYKRIKSQDFKYNAVINFGSGVPVPGRYRIPSHWTKILQKYGFEIIERTDHGKDMQIITDEHSLLVFQKVAEAIAPSGLITRDGTPLSVLRKELVAPDGSLLYQDEPESQPPIILNTPCL
jgi:SAM-dependent methyltransferase